MSMATISLCFFIFAILTKVPSDAFPLIPQAPYSCSSSVCHQIVQIPHKPNDKVISVPLYLWYPRQISQRPHLSLFTPAALVRAGSYTGISHRLASAHGHVVAIPEYTARLPAPNETLYDHLATTAEAYGCPPQGSYPSALLYVSIGHFFSEQQRLKRLRVKFHKDMLFLGHSLGAVIASMALLGQCQNPPIIPFNPALDFLCESYRAPPMQTLPGIGLRIIMLVMFEGRILNSGNTIPKDIGIVQVLSDIATDTTKNSLNDAITRNDESDRRVAEITLKENISNHLLPVDFAKETKHARSRCSFPRPPPQDTFETDAATQIAVVRECADLAGWAFWARRFRSMLFIPKTFDGFPLVEKAVMLFVKRRV